MNVVFLKYVWEHSTPPISPPQHVWLLSAALRILVGWLHPKPIACGLSALNMGRLEAQDLSDLPFFFIRGMRLYAAWSVCGRQ